MIMKVVNENKKRTPNAAQKLAINFPCLEDKLYKNKNILVSAAAGSGKTWVLIERIIRLLTVGYENSDEEVTLQNILVMTFTIKATQEMRKKIRDALENEIKEQNDVKKSSKIIKECATIQNANITTIDSFCKSILEENYVELDENNSLYGNFDPSYKVIDGKELDVIYDDCIDFLLDKYYATDKYQPLFIHYIKKGNDQDFKAMCRDVLSKLSSIPWPHEYIQNKIKTFDEDCTKAVEEYIKDVYNELNSLQKECEKITKSMYDFFDFAKDERFNIDLKRYDKFVDAHKEVITSIENFKNLKLDLKNLDLFYKSINKRPDIPNPGKSSNDIDKSYYAIKKERFKLTRDKIFNYLCEIYDSIAFANSLLISNDSKYFVQDKLFLEFIDELYLEVVKEKKKKNVIYVSDFANLSLDILYNKKLDERGLYIRYISNRAKEIASKYKYIFIDEYQDTNFIQELLLKALTDNFKSQNAFMVGDLKQSIYGFRSSVPSIFADKFKSYTKNIDKLDEKDGLLIDLSTNYRCSSKIISFVNNVFSKIMKKDFGIIDYANDGMLTIPDDKDDVNAPKVNVDVIYDDSEDKETDKTTLEAEYVADKIRELVNSKHYDYKDIVILHRSASIIADTFSDVFSKYGIPVYAEQKSGFFKSEEIMLMVDILNVINNPRQNIPLLNVCTSNLYSISFEELALIKILYFDAKKLDKNCDFMLYDALEFFYNNFEDIKEKNETFNVDVIKLYGKIKAFYNQYKKLSEASRYKSISDMIYEIYDIMHIKNIFSIDRNGKLKVSNLDKLYDFAKSYENSSYVGLFNFLRYIEKIDSLEDDQGQAKIFDENDNVVNIMTIHQSKGLEFKYVFLCGCGRKYNKNDYNDNNKICFSEKYGVSLKYFDVEKKFYMSTPKRDLVMSIKENENLQEEMRLLYVALTRAKTGLSIVAVAHKNKRNNFSVDDMKKLMYERKCVVNGDEINYKIKECDSYIDILIKYFPYDDNFCKLSYVPINKPKLEMHDDITYDYNNLDKLKDDTSDEVGLYKDFLSRFSKKSLDTQMTDTYKFNDLQFIEPKFSVSSIKKEAKDSLLRKDDISIVNLGFDEIPDDLEIINQNKERMDGTKIGTAYHRYMQYYNYENDEYDSRELDKENTVEPLVSKEKIDNFNKTELGKRFKIAYNSHKLYREQKFMKLFSNNEINKFLGKDFSDSKIDDMRQIIIQGIIDAFFVEYDKNNDEKYLILVDYKTDKINDKLDVENFTKYLVDNYKIQLSIYKNILESITGLKVRESYIYSFALDKEILL